MKGTREHIQHRAGEPDRDFHAHGDGFAVLDFALHVGLVRTALPFAQGQIAAQTQAIGDQQQAAQQRAYRERLSGKKKIQAFAGDGKAVADGEEPDIMLETNGADEHGHQEQKQDARGEYHIAASQIDHIILVKIHTCFMRGVTDRSIVHSMVSVKEYEMT